LGTETALTDSWQQYVHGATSLLAIQIDAAINPGNSGGIALKPNSQNNAPTLA
jgi:S1-C subfamily serine protease